MRKYRIHQTIEYIRSQLEFPFDAADVEERLDTVLAHYGVEIALTPEERQEFIRYLLPRGLAFEVGEMARIRQKQEDYRMGVHVPIPDDRTLERRRSRFFQQHAERLNRGLLILIGCLKSSPVGRAGCLRAPVNASYPLEGRRAECAE